MPSPKLSPELLAIMTAVRKRAAGGFAFTLSPKAVQAAVDAGSPDWATRSYRIAAWDALREELNIDFNPAADGLTWVYTVRPTFKTGYRSDWPPEPSPKPRQENGFGRWVDGMSGWNDPQTWYDGPPTPVRTVVAKPANARQPGLSGAGSTTVKTPRNSNKAAWSSGVLRDLQKNVTTFDPDIEELFECVRAEVSRGRDKYAYRDELDFVANFGTGTLPDDPNTEVIAVTVTKPASCMLRVYKRLISGRTVFSCEGVTDRLTASQQDLKDVIMASMGLPPRVVAGGAQPYPSPPSFTPDRAPAQALPEQTLPHKRKRQITL